MVPTTVSHLIDNLYYRTPIGLGKSIIPLATVPLSAEDLATLRHRVLLREGEAVDHVLLRRLLVLRITVSATVGLR